MTKEKAKIIEKVKKLHAKAENAEEIGSQDEANAFAAKVKQMMDMHKLTMSDIAYKEYEQSDIHDVILRWSQFGHKDIGKREQWTASLLHHVAQFHSCKTFVYKGTNRCRLIGREEDIEAVKSLLSVLVPVCLKLCKKAYHKIYWEVRPPKSNMPVYERKAILKGFRASWKVGFIDGVFDALAEQEEKSKEEAAEQGYAVIRLSGCVQAVNDYVSTNLRVSKKSYSHSSRVRHNSRGYEEGEKTGRASINRDRLEG
jgi:hypothetical protein